MERNKQKRWRSFLPPGNYLARARLISGGWIYKNQSLNARAFFPRLSEKQTKEKEKQASRFVTWQTKLVPVRRWNLITSHTLIPQRSRHKRRAAVIIASANKAIYLYHFAARKKETFFYSYRLRVTFICFSLLRDWRSSMRNCEQS